MSPAASTTAARMAVYEVLLTDRSLESAVLVAPQHADDPSPDLDDTALTLELSTRGAIGDTAARWRARLADVLPPLHVKVSTSASSSSVLENAVRPGDRSVDIDAGFSDADALIDVARHLDRSTERVSYFIGGDSCTIEVVASREAWAENAAFLGAHVPPGCTLRRSSTV